MEQHLDMLRQLQDSYAHDNETELKDARRIAALHEEIAQLCHEDEQDIMNFIRGMQEEVREAEAAAAPPDPALHERQVADLEAACSDSLSRIAGLQNEIRYMTGHARHLAGLVALPCGMIRDLEEQQGELRERRSSTEEGAAAEMRRIRQTDPKLRNELSLYANITRIAWKYGMSDVTGTVSDRQQKDLRPFSFDPAAMSEFDMANRLWDVVA